jgi:hypothetical protein
VLSSLSLSPASPVSLSDSSGTGFDDSFSATAVVPSPLASSVSFAFSCALFFSSTCFFRYSLVASFILIWYQKMEQMHFIELSLRTY